jgi:hypothetical protein
VSKKQKINLADLAPGIAEGFTDGASAEEAFAEADHKRPLEKHGAADVIKHMAGVDEKLTKNRGGFAGFVAESDTGSIWSDGATDRIQQDLHKTYTAGGLRLLREGRQCLRCDEPFEEAFPVTCPICSYAVKDRQIIDIAYEFEGEKHLGPSKPITEYMEEQEARAEKRRYIKRILGGGQGKVPAEWLKDKDLLEGLTPQQRYAIGVRE